MAETELNLADFKQRLEALSKNLHDLLEQSAASGQTVELDQSKVGRLSRMDAMQNQAMAKAGIERQRQQLVDVRRALARIETGDYGYCAKCDAPIAVARLDINPVVQFCVKCAEQLEQR